MASDQSIATRIKEMERVAVAREVFLADLKAKYKEKISESESNLQKIKEKNKELVNFKPKSDSELSNEINLLSARRDSLDSLRQRESVVDLLRRVSVRMDAIGRKRCEEEPKKWKNGIQKDLNEIADQLIEGMGENPHEEANVVSKISWIFLFEIY